MKAHRKHIGRLSFSNIFPVIIISALALFVLISRQNKNSSSISEMTTIPAEVKTAAAAHIVPHTNVLPGETTRLPILLYHYVEYVRDRGDTIRQSLDILPSTFEAEIKTLQDNGYTFITMSDFVDKSKRLPPKPIVMTFDDGYRDFYTDVFPILKKYNVRAVAYIVPGFLDRPNYMDKWMIEEIVKSGLVEIGAHTVHHVYLAGMSEPVARDEIVRSKIMLEQEFRVPVTAFAYPYGAFDLSAIKLVRDAGFTSAVSTVLGIKASNENQFYLFRIRPGGRTGANLINFLEHL